jgi:hypothetical protein
MASIFLKIPIILAYPYAQQYGEICDWRGPAENCDQSRGLTCQYSTSTCSCWDLRRIYSMKIHRCVGKSGEECVYHETERLCTENAYCLEDRTFSPIPLCVCLKGYFRSDNGTCIKYSKLGEPCQPFPSRQACEPETGLTCSPRLKCECEQDQIYDPVKELCIAKAGQKCSRTLNNCIENAKCDDKMWAYDYTTGDTKIIGYRCGCKSGLKVTYDGLCASDYGGSCNKTSDCYSGESLSCLNGICQCHPLSQIYDKKARRCFNLVGTRCHLPSSSQNNLSHANNISRREKSTDSYNNNNNSTSKPNGAQADDDGKDSFSSGMSLMMGRMESADCTPNAECVPSTSSSTTGPSVCKCVNGSSETLMKTCLLDYGQSCQNTGASSSEARNMIQQRTYVLLKPDENSKEMLLGQEMKCNVFEGLICHSDSGKCLCADPSLVYDKEARACVSTVGNPCGNVKLDLLDLDEEFKSMIFIDCLSNSTCAERNINGKFKRVCVPDVYYGSRGMINSGGGGGGNGLGLANGSLSLSKIMFNNANVINDSE